MLRKLLITYYKWQTERWIRRYAVQRAIGESSNKAYDKYKYNMKQLQKLTLLSPF